MWNLTEFKNDIMNIKLTFDYPFEISPNVIYD